MRYLLVRKVYFLIHHFLVTLQEKHQPKGYILHLAQFLKV